MLYQRDGGERKCSGVLLAKYEVVLSSREYSIINDVYQKFCEASVLSSFHVWVVE